jgi:hypothetical protein
MADGHSARGISARVVLLVGAVLLAGASCAKEEKKLVVRPECPSVDAKDYYFPEGALYPSQAKIDVLLRDWFSKYLRAMKEPSLSCGTRTEGYVYRFLWLRSSHHPIAMRVEKTGSSVLFTAVESDGTGGHEPGRIVKRIERRALSQAEQDQFSQKLREVKLWEMPKNKDMFGSNGGAQWIMEGAEGGRYQVVERCSPAPGAYRDLGFLLIAFTGIKLSMLEYY